MKAFLGLSVSIFLALSACGDISEPSSSMDTKAVPRISDADFAKAKIICESSGTITPHYRNLDAAITTPPLCAPNTTPSAWNVEFVFPDLSEPVVTAFRDVSHLSHDLPFKKASNAKPSSPDGYQNHLCVWSSRIDSETYPRAKLQISYDRMIVSKDMKYFQNGGRRTDGLSFALEFKVNEDAVGHFDLDFPGASFDENFPFDCSKPYTLEARSLVTPEGSGSDNVIQAVITPIYD